MGRWGAVGLVLTWALGAFLGCSGSSSGTPCCSSLQTGFAQASWPGPDCVCGTVYPSTGTTCTVAPNISGGCTMTCTQDGFEQSIQGAVVATCGGAGTSSASSSSGGSLAPPVGCTGDSTIGCTGGASGFTCAAGDNPEAEDVTLACSTPTADSSGNDLYCCTTWNGSSTTCVANDSLSSLCSPTGGGDYGFDCMAGDDPTSVDSSLVCDSGTPDATDPSLTDFCCSVP